jgi:hypothetical protein
MFCCLGIKCSQKEKPNTRKDHENETLELYHIEQNFLSRFLLIQLHSVEIL